MKQLILATLALGLCLLAPAAGDATAEDTAVLSFTDMHKMAERAYRLTKLYDGTEGTGQEARGQSLSARNLMILGRRGIIEYYVASHRDETTGTVRSWIVVETTGSEAVEDDTTLMPASRRRTAGARMHQWNGYTARYLKKNTLIDLAVATLEGRTGKARLGATEELEIPVETADLFAPVKVGSGIRVTLHSEVSGDMQLEIPFAYLVGYFARTAEENYLAAADKQLVERLRAALRAKAGT
ncbi:MULTISPECIES: hypothetical protein [Kordiimonas]|jgi:hypothetical protein|uniref:hypothetical protein n=1 Tax=Kordiimonas TaxID=288021 RepID=UPI00257B4281|nr:hypothetical protein [Kordiimonas sp. UBA4487]